MISWSKLQEFGELHIFEKNIIFFGNQNFQLEQIKEYIPNHSILHQIHGKLVIPSTDTLEKADGHFTNKAKHALIIKTADCMPVMISCGSQIFGLHIGWRSLAQKILTESILHVEQKEDIHLWVGPHIQKSRFSLDTQSLESLLTPHRLSIKRALDLGIITLSFEQKNHYLVSLKDILLKEAYENGISNFYSSDIDTYWSCNHYSHRRNPKRKGTNYSFILKG